jgi:hypothetical protein
MRALLLAVLCAAPAAAQEEYGARGIFPVYDTGAQWAVFDKGAKRGGAAELAPGGTFLVVGDAGAGLFSLARSSPTYGGSCRANKPVRLRAGLLRGPRSAVGDPVIAVKVAPSFSLKGSRAVYKSLPDKADEPLYRKLGPALAEAAAAEAKAGAYKFKPEDEGAAAFLADPKPEKVALKIDWASPVDIKGLQDTWALVTGAQISSAFRRCLRLAHGDKLLGDCVEMPHDLMAETALLRFVLYDPSGKGQPFLLGYTPSEPMWGHERWGFALKPSGPKLFLRDAMDPRCRAGF